MESICCLALAWALPGSTLHAATPQDFQSAKLAADADEASQDATAKAAMQAAQKAFLDARVEACATEGNKADLSNFVVVMRLDDTGHVARTWRRGDSPLALCVERQSRGKLVFVPPRSPFYSSLEISFVP